jgi:7 transmembrane receptor (rhodopsin family)
MSCPVTTEEYIINTLRNNEILQDLTLFLSAICIFGGTTVLIAIFRSRPFTPHLLLVASLTFSDILLAIQAVIFLLYSSKQAGIVQSCQIGAFFANFGVVVSLMSFGMITIERYLVICHDLKDHLTKTITAIVVANIFSIVTGVILASSSDYVDIGGFVLCHPKFCSRSLAMVIVNISCVSVLLVFMASVVYCPYQILQLYSAKSSSAGDSILAAENKRADNERKIRERKVFFKLSIITGCFIAMLGPMGIALVYEISTGNATPPILASIYGILVAFNSASNPILLYNFDISVKTRINQLFGIRKRTRVLSSPRQNNSLQPPINLAGNHSLNIRDTKEFSARDTVKVTLTPNPSSKII